jgi:hypothetical protein
VSFWQCRSEHQKGCSENNEPESVEAKLGQLVVFERFDNDHQQAVQIELNLELLMAQLQIQWLLKCEQCHV